MNPKNKEFQKLQNEWYFKLKESGFDDIEQDESHLKSWTTSKKPSPRVESQSSYYRLAGFFLHDYKFKNEIDKKIWEYHSQGLTQRKIVEKLKEVGIKRARTPVQYRIWRLEKEMIKLYGTDY